MTSHTARLYVLAATLGAFFVLWVTIAAKPWAAPAATPAEPQVDPRLVALNRRERALRREAVLVKRQLDRRWAAYRKQLHVREAAIASAKRRHARELAAAAAARARIAALEVAHARAARQQAQASPVRTVVTTRVTRVQQPAAAPSPAPAPAPAPAPQPAPAPPSVKIVPLPPATAPTTRSTSSMP